ncbi:GNAT family N-acetyltransferase [Tropicimonas sp. IMCC6043]|uniref:GNAT family N-acetyltransferase n=1 Tax=Tropicimonas sp. IMCC6043 TaxID=2510645 RepID=UPI00101D4AD2|nr:GNAT family N-acetyltransferase [Tropicimonas sp. IMCC6043]RYH08042.1 N-acetyltransferase [Tropicimonas sp. IMCC6043]
MSLEIRPLSGAAIAAALDDLAALRIAVFRDFPYLYDGDLAYERNYLATYESTPDAILVGAFDGVRLVGAATGTPMEAHAAEFADPLARAGLDPRDVFYCAESVLLPAYRGQGTGHAFFDFREAHARALGRKRSVFCAVIRPPDHPLRPASYRPLDGFWRRRGYAPRPGIVASFRWKDIDETKTSTKQLQFWETTL